MHAHTETACDHTNQAQSEETKASTDLVDPELGSDFPRVKRMPAEARQDKPRESGCRWIFGGCPKSLSSKVCAHLLVPRKGKNMIISHEATHEEE